MSGRSTQRETPETLRIELRLSRVSAGFTMGFIACCGLAVLIVSSPRVGAMAAILVSAAVMAVLMLWYWFQQCRAPAVLALRADTITLWRRGGSPGAAGQPLRLIAVKAGVVLMRAGRVANAGTVVLLLADTMNPSQYRVLACRVRSVGRVL